MSGTIIVGLQVGDEGKGKVTDYFSERSQYVVRYQGGNNAGHTVAVGNKTYKFHLLPSGVVQKKRCCIAAGVIIDPRVLAKEITEFGNKLDLVIDPRAHIIMPYHVTLDVLAEGKSGDVKIGTTGRGIGPCYADRAARVGVRFEELINREKLSAKLDKVYPLKQKIIEKAYDTPAPFTKESILAEYAALGEKLAPFMGDVSLEIHNALEANKAVLFEGAQGMFLDNDFGTYPFVTASHPIAGGMFIGVGIGTAHIDRIIGVTKAYMTRVGGGPMPTELFGTEADALRTKGNEFGTTTGRPRRVAWLDLPMLRTALRINGCNEIAIMKLDVLSGLPKVKIGVSYTINGKETKEFPFDTTAAEKATVNYKELSGFTFDPTKVKKKEDLPKEAREYLEFIAKELNTKIMMVSIGPERSQTILL